MNLLTRQVPLILIALICLLANCACQTQTLRNSTDFPVVPVTGETVEARHGVVVSVSSAGSAVGRDILMRGGNAVDAAVATAFALAVSFPEAGNIGGGGFMVIHPGRGAVPVVVDYRETAPASVAADTFVAAGSPTPHRLVGVPGTVRGLAAAHDRFGRLPWRDLVLPAAALAADGFELNQDLAQSLNAALTQPGNEADEMRRVLRKPGGGRWAAGDRLVQPELASTLRRIAEHGPSGFYDGEVAASIVQTLAEGRGLITLTDLSKYEAKFRKPVHGMFRGFDVYGPPPPSSGGICLIEMLNVLAQFDLRRNDRWSPQTLHLMIETMRRVYLDRARFLGDPDFAQAPQRLTEQDYAAQLARQIDPARATPSEALSKDLSLAPEGTQTTHFSVVDSSGMAVSNTYTLEQRYGGRVMVRGRGFLLNNEMGDFNLRPGVTDRLGHIGTAPNLVAPGKRMLSSMTPVIIAKDGRVTMVTGSPGGRSIINTVLSVVLNRLEFGMSPREAVDAPRFSHAWFPDQVSAEAGLLQNHLATVSRLRELGHRVAESPAGQGDAHSIFLGPDGQLIGVADQRRSGTAAGY